MEEEELIFALPDGEEESEEDETLVLALLSPEEAYAILNTPETDDSDYVVRHLAWNPR